MTAAALIEAALNELGAYGAGQTIDATDQAAALVRLNAMLHTWGVRGNLYRDETGTATITGGVGSGTLPAEVRQLNSVRFVASATNYRQLTEWTRDDYYSIPNRDQAGDPVAYYLQRHRDGAMIWLWPVPADDATLHLDYGSAVETVTAASETVDLPQEWQEAAILGLAARCASMFGTTRIDPGTVRRIDQRAAEAYGLLLDSDRPDSYIFLPDSR